MALLKCKMCGGELEVIPGVTVAECEYCGTRQTLPRVGDETVQNLFNRANSLRLKCEFDKAERIYEKILHENDAEAEAHWGIVLCKYGIEYVEDPKTMNRIPTCHRTSYDAVITDGDYLAALEHADALQRSIYEAEARKIDEIQKNILNIVKNEKPFDVFICYKETDENGRRTPDSAIANDIYYQLTQEGLKVFYAAITLEDKLGQAYEPYIFAALNSAKVMLVIGTKPHYFTSVWVKNEWSRFLKLMKTDRSKLLIPCYKDMDAYELPEEFAHLQAQDMAKIGFINDIVRGIRKVAGKETAAAPVAQPAVREVAAVPAVAPLLDRAYLFLEDGAWDSAEEYLEKVLDADPRNAEAYLGKLMVELKIRKKDDLPNQTQPFGHNANYQKAMRFGDADLKATLEGYIDQINIRNEQDRLERLYAVAVQAVHGANSEKSWLDAARQFEAVGNFRDSQKQAEECREKAETVRKDDILAAAMAKMTGSKIERYQEAITLLSSIAGWKSADSLVQTCKHKIGALEEAAEAERQRREMEAQQRREEAKERAKRTKKIAVIVLPVACLVLIIAILLPNILPILGGSGDDKTTEPTIMQTCSHQFEDATCSEPKHCKICGATEGTTLEHVLSEATCSAPKTCLRCGETVGEPLEHLISGVTCTEDGTCIRCGATIPALDHDYGEATCTQASKCARCGETTGKSLGHSYSKATCTAAKKCTRCGSISGSALGHEFDSSGKCIRCSEKIANAKVKDVIQLGRYEQDNNLDNGAEVIEWYVLARDGNKVLLYSKYTLDTMEFGTSYWNTSFVRAWLNGSFMSEAFSESEASKIITTTLSNGEGPETQDKVFLLSKDEAYKYLWNGSYWTEYSPYAAAAKGSADRRWLRTVCLKYSYYYYVDYIGGVSTDGTPFLYAGMSEPLVNGTKLGVCPAMWIDLSVA